MIDNYISVFHKEQKDKLYRIYVTDTLRLLTENTAKHVGGTYIQAHYSDFLEPQKQVDKEKEEQDAEAVITNIMDKLRKV